MGPQDALAPQALPQIPKRSFSEIVFDAGSLIALERNNRQVFAILATALQDGDRILVPDCSRSGYSESRQAGAPLAHDPALLN